MGNPNGYSPPGSGGFVRGLMGGVAGGFLGSMLFRGMGNGGGGMPGTGGIGLFEILLILGGGFFIYRMFSQRKEAGRGGYSGMSAYEKLRSVEPGPYAQQGQVVASSGEDAALQSLQESDSGFNLTRFKEDRMDDFLRLQSSWNLRDLSSVSSMITPDLRQELEKDITQLKNSHQINKIENIAVRSTDLIEAWQSDGKEFATLRFRANLLDYTIDEESGSLVAGDKTQPVKFEEDWTFVRRLGASGAWTLSAIEA